MSLSELFSVLKRRLCTVCLVHLVSQAEWPKLPGLLSPSRVLCKRTTRATGTLEEEVVGRE